MHNRSSIFDHSSCTTHVELFRQHVQANRVRNIGFSSPNDDGMRVNNGLSRRSIATESVGSLSCCARSSVSPRARKSTCFVRGSNAALNTNLTTVELLTKDTRSFFDDLALKTAVNAMIFSYSSFPVNIQNAIDREIL